MSSLSRPPLNDPILYKRKGQMIMNDRWTEWLDGIHSVREVWMQALIDPRRDLDSECGYPHVILPRQYRFMYDREGISARVVNIYPDECAALTPHVFVK